MVDPSVAAAGYMALPLSQVGVLVRRAILGHGFSVGDVRGEFFSVGQSYSVGFFIGNHGLFCLCSAFGLDNYVLWDAQVPKSILEPKIKEETFAQ